MIYQVLRYQFSSPIPNTGKTVNTSPYYVPVQAVLLSTKSMAQALTIVELGLGNARHDVSIDGTWGGS